MYLVREISSEFSFRILWATASIPDMTDPQALPQSFDRLPHAMTVRSVVLRCTFTW